MQIIDLRKWFAKGTVARGKGHDQLDKLKPVFVRPFYILMNTLNDWTGALMLNIARAKSFRETPNSSTKACSNRG